MLAAICWTFTKSVQNTLGIPRIKLIVLLVSSLRIRVHLDIATVFVDVVLLVGGCCSDRSGGGPR